MLYYKRPHCGTIKLFSISIYLFSIQGYTGVTLARGKRNPGKVISSSQGCHMETNNHMPYINTTQYKITNYSNLHVFGLGKKKNTWTELWDDIAKHCTTLQPPGLFLPNVQSILIKICCYAMLLTETTGLETNMSSLKQSVHVNQKFEATKQCLYLLSAFALYTELVCRCRIT